MDHKSLQSLNQPLLTEFEIHELDSRLQLEMLEERLELGCWVQCKDLCIET